MATLIAFTLLIGIFIVVGMAATTWGTDSRPTLGDDHAR
jgi:hypothetical protein